MQQHFHQHMILGFFCDRCLTVFFLQVGEMKKELVDLQPKLEQAKIDNTKMMKVL